MPPRVRIARDKPHVQFGQAAINTPVGQGLPDVDELWDEIHGYVDVILGRVESPIETVGYLGLAELATAYHARALEIEMLIHNAEREGVVIRGSQLYKFRTGELRSFIDLTKRAAELGSRRLTQEQLMYQMRLEETT
jgi:hypothetical protein